MMCPGLAGGSGLEQAIVDADADMPPEGLPVASERQVDTLQIFSLRSGT